MLSSCRPLIHRALVALAALAILGCASSKEQLTDAVTRGDSGSISRIASTEQGREAAARLLIARVRSGDIAGVRVLLDAGADKAVERGDTTPLMHAALTGQVEIARLLLDRGADANTRNDTLILRPWNGAPPSSSSSTINVSQYGLLKLMGPEAYAGSTSNYRLEEAGGSGDCALSYAIVERHIEIVKLLLQRGADRSLTVVRGDPQFALLENLGIYARRYTLRTKKSVQIEARNTAGQEIFFRNIGGYVTSNSAIKPQQIVSLKELARLSGVPEISALFGE